MRYLLSLSVIFLSPVFGNNTAHKIETSAIHEAVANGNFLNVQSFIANNVDVNLQTHDGQTPLHIASWSGHLKIIKYLLEQGANVNAINRNGETPLHYADRKDTVELLIAKGANVNAQDYDKWTPLHFASQDGQLEVIQSLIENGANLYIKTKTSSLSNGNGEGKSEGNTPLDLARQESNQSVIKYLENAEKQESAVKSFKNNSHCQKAFALGNAH